MTTESYLKKYNRNELLLLRWLQQNGIDLVIGIAVIRKFAKEKRIYNTGYDLDHAILDEAKLYFGEPVDTIEAQLVIARLKSKLEIEYRTHNSFWKRFKRWIRGQ